MPARKQRWHPENVRQKIQASQIINRLTAHLNSKKPLMDSTQVAAARILLNKVLPDLQGIVLSGDADNPVVTRILEEIVDPAAKKQK